MRKKINFIFLLISFVHFVITFFTDKFIFNTQSLNIINYKSCKILLLIILVFFWQFIYKCIKKEEKYFKYLKYFLIYFIPIIFLLFILWPGTWYGADLHSFYSATTTAGYLYYLNYQTSVFYIIGYMLFPCTSGPVILLSILFSVVYSYIIKNLFDIYKTKLVYLFSIPFILFHTLFYVYYANRPIMFGVLYLLLISILIFDYISQNKLTTKKLIFISILTAVVGHWRSESIYLILVIPVLMFITYKQKINVKNVIKTFGLIFVSFIIVCFPQKYDEFKYKTDAPSSRNLPMYVSPLSYMLNFELKGKNIKKDLSNIDKVLDIDLMKKYASFVDTPSVWSEGGCIKDYTTKEYNKFKKSYFNVIKNNLPLFIKTKIYTFGVSSSVRGDYFTSIDLYSNNNNLVENRKDTKSIVGYKIRSIAYSIIEGKTNFKIYNLIYKITQNLLIPIIFIMIFFIYSIFRKKLLYFLISGMLLGHTLIVFLTAPAAYFMYYFNVYLVGWFLGIFLIFNFIYKNKKAKFDKKTKIC